MITAVSRQELTALVAQRAALLDAADNPFATAAWLGHYLEQVASPDAQFWAGEAEGALLLLQADGQAAGQVRALTNYYASQFSPFVGGAAGAPLALARELGARRMATVDLSPLSVADADAAQDAFKTDGWFTRRYACFGNWTLPCAGLGFDDYMAARPSQTIHTWKRKARKFSAGAGEARLQLVTQPAEVDAAMRAYDAVYAKSWKQPEPYPQFVTGWAAICAERGWLRLGLAWAGEVPIAAQFWFTVNSRAYIFKLAYDEAHSKLSAGTVLSAFMFKQALDVDRVIEVDYLTGDDPYKQAWMTERRERVGVIACNPRTLRGAARAGYEWLGAWRQRVQQRRPSAAMRARMTPAHEVLS